MERQGLSKGAVSRRKFIVLAGGSVAATSVLAACGSDASADSETSDFGDGDVGILNYALTLEYAEVSFYTALAKSDRFDAAERKALGKFGEEEEEHVSTLTKAVEKLGGEPAAEETTEFSLKTDQGTLEIASNLENLGAAAYLGQVPNVESPAVLTTLLSIHSVEGRHASAINSLLGEPIAPDGAFAKPASVKSVIASLETIAEEPGAKESGGKLPPVKNGSA